MCSKKTQILDLKDAFSNEARELCRSAMEHSNGLAEALQCCEGLFPAIALDEFFKLNKEVTDLWIKQANEDLLLDRLTHSQQDSFALSMWRFSKTSRKTLSKILWEEGLRVCLLGVPTLVDYLPSSSNRVKNLLIDISDSSTVNQRKAFHLPYDINLLDGSEFPDSFDVCVLDPPWYLQNYKKWIDVASSYCRKGGIVAFPLLGRMTRPTASVERDEILADCEARGFQVTVHANGVLYDVPSFERSIFLRDGMPPVRWKRADLVVARSQKKIAAIWDGVGRRVMNARPIKPIKQLVVREHLVDVVLDRHQGVEGELLRIPRGGYWMKTPSRSEEGVGDCNVFVSNGARFISDRPMELASLLRELRGTKGKLTALGFPSDVFV